jgi:hypothetical protein
MLLAIIYSLTLLLGWFPGNPGAATVQQRLQAEVRDTGRRTVALAAYEQMLDERHRYDEAVHRRAPEVEHLVHNQRAARPAFEQLLGSFDADRAVATRRILAARARLRAALTAAEWRAVFQR